MKRFLTLAIILLFFLQLLAGINIESDNEHVGKITSLDTPSAGADGPSLGGQTRTTKNESHDFGSSWFDDLEDGSGLSDSSGVLVSGGKVWTDSWMYSREITVTNSGNTLTGYQMELNLTPGSFNYSRADENGDDIRFRDSNGNELNYWLEEWNASGASKIWVKVTSIPVGNSQILMYYGNPYVAPVSNGTTTFEFFDDFEGSAPNGNAWTVHGTPSISEGMLRLRTAGDDLITNSKWGYNVSLSGRVRFYNSSLNQVSIFGLDDAQDGGSTPYEFFSNRGNNVLRAITSDGSFAQVNSSYLDTFQEYGIHRYSPGDLHFEVNDLNVFSAPSPTDSQLGVRICQFGVDAYVDVDMLFLRKTTKTGPGHQLGPEMQHHFHVTSTRISLPPGVLWSHLSIHKTEPVGTFINGSVLNGLSGTVIPGFENLTLHEIDLERLNNVGVAFIKIKAWMTGTGREAPFLESWGVEWNSSRSWRDSFTGDGRTRRGKEFESDEYSLGLWHFNEGQGNGLKDASPNSNNGTLRNMGEGNWVKGKFGDGLYFNGSDNYVEIEDGPGIRIDGEFTVEAWVYRTAPYHFEDWRDTRVAVSKGRFGILGAYNLLTRVNSTDHVSYGFNVKFVNSPTNGDEVEWQSPFELGTWHYVAGEYDGTHMSIWVDGIKRVEKELIGKSMAASTKKLNLGRMTDYENQYFFEGRVDEVRISNISRTPAEIWENYRAGLSFKNGQVQLANEQVNNGTSINFSIDGAFRSESIRLPENHTWDRFYLNRSVPGNTHLNVTIRDAGSDEVLWNGSQDLDDDDIDISYLIAFENPAIYFEARFSSNGSETPELHDWGVNWTPIVPPGLISDVEDVFVWEERPRKNIVNLSQNFDDIYGHLHPSSYEVFSVSNTSNINIGMNGSHLDVFRLAENFTGSIEVVMACENIYNRTTLSNTFNIIVRNLDDSPVWLSIPPSIVLDEGTTKVADYSLGDHAYDVDGDELEFQVSAAGPNISARLTDGDHLEVTALGDFYGNVNINVSAHQMSNYSKTTSNVTIPVTVEPVNDPPEVQLLSPSNGSVMGDVNVTFHWRGADIDDNVSGLTYDLYLGRSEFLEIYREDIAGLEYSPGNLDNGTTYYWKVVPHDGKSEGFCMNGTWNVQIDTSVPVPEVRLVMPYEGTVSDTMTLNLTWEMSSPKGDIHGYNIYLGTSPEKLLKIAYTENTTFTLVDLLDKTVYYWKVVPVSGYAEGRCLSGIRSFTIDTSFIPSYSIIAEFPGGAVDIIHGNGTTFNLTMNNTGNIHTTVTLEPLGNISGFVSLRSSILISPAKSVNVPVSIMDTSALKIGTYNLTIRIGYSNISNTITVPVNIISGESQPENGNDDDDGTGTDKGSDTGWIILLIVIFLLLVVAAAVIIFRRKRRGSEKARMEEISRRYEETDIIEPGGVPSILNTDESASVIPAVHDAAGTPPLPIPLAHGIAPGMQHSYVSEMGVTHLDAMVPSPAGTFPGKAGIDGIGEVPHGQASVSIPAMAPAQISSSPDTLPPSPGRATAMPHGPQIIGANKEFAMSDLFLIYVDGRLVKSVSFETQLREGMDEDIMSGMLTAITDFIKDSFKEDSGALRTLQYGKMTIFLERGVGMYVAAVFQGNAPAELREKMRWLLIRIWKKFKYYLKVWDGSYDGLDGIGDVLRGLLDQTEPKEEEDLPELPGPAVENGEEKGVVVSVATEAVMCNICMGVVKPGLEISTCGCGNKYHRSCGDRVAQCPKCGLSLSLTGTISEPAEQTEGVEESDMGPEELPSTAGSSSLCPICMGVIKTGLEVTRCSCGNKYHPACANRLVACPECGEPFLLTDSMVLRDDHDDGTAPPVEEPVLTQGESTMDGTRMLPAPPSEKEEEEGDEFRIEL